MLSFSKSSYFYALHRENKTDKYQKVRETIKTVFFSNYNCYGYRRINYVLKNSYGIRLSEKTTRRLMKEESLNAKPHKRKRYFSYLGEISTVAENIVKRDFSADKPNQKWLTDISEFAIASGKLYLSIIRDCYNDEIIAWKIGKRASARLANLTLECAIRKTNCHSTIVHSDRGCHYRWTEWIKIMEKSGLIRSMSNKGSTPDNAGCECVFGRIKNECFYNHDFKGYHLEKFKDYIDKYIYWYNNERIKLNLGGMSPV